MARFDPHGARRGRQARGGPIAASPRRRGDELARLVERLVASGRLPDVIERMIADWMRYDGQTTADVPEVLREVGLPQPRNLQGRAFIERIAARIRRPGSGPTVTPLPPFTGLGAIARARGTAWFEHLEGAALTSRWAIAASGWAPSSRAPGPPTVRRYDQVATALHGLGAVLPRPVTWVAPTMAPGVYALQLDAADGLAAGRGPSAADVLARLGRGCPIEAEVQARLGPRLEAAGLALDLAHVVIHDGPEADALCRELRAHAFAVGRHVAFRAGRFRPEDPDGLALLAHELTHVWQQARAMVGPRGGVLADPRLEREADLVGARVASLATLPTSIAEPAADVTGPLATSAGADAAAGPVQRCADPAGSRGRRPQGAPSPAGDLPAPRGRTTDALMSEARTVMARARLRPSALFLVTDRVVAYDAGLTSRGSWRLSGPCPLAAGYWFDGGVGVAGWVERLDEARVRQIANGRADDLWVVGAQHAGAAPATPPEHPEASPTAGREPETQAPVALRAAASGGARVATPTVDEVVARLGAGRPLPDALAADLAARFAASGAPIDLTRARIHTGPEADALCRDLGAKAFAVGDHVAFASGTFAPESPAGLELIAHELAHVAQAARGVVPSLPGRAAVGLPAAREAALEAQADALSEKVLAAAAPAPATETPLATAPIPAVDTPATLVQRYRQEAEDEAAQRHLIWLMPRANGLPELATEGRAVIARITAQVSMNFGMVYIFAERFGFWAPNGERLGDWPYRTRPTSMPSGFYLLVDNHFQRLGETGGQPNQLGIVDAGAGFNINDVPEIGDERPPLMSGAALYIFGPGFGGQAEPQPSATAQEQETGGASQQPAPPGGNTTSSGQSRQRRRQARIDRQARRAEARAQRALAELDRLGQQQAQQLQGRQGASARGAPDGTRDVRESQNVFMGGTPSGRPLDVALDATLEGPEQATSGATSEYDMRLAVGAGVTGGAAILEEARAVERGVYRFEVIDITQEAQDASGLGATRANAHRTIGQRAVGQGTHVGRFDGARRDRSREWHNMWTDTTQAQRDAESESAAADRALIHGHPGEAAANATAALGNRLSVLLTPVSALALFGRQSIRRLADAIGGHPSQREIPWGANQQGVFAVRCIAQPRDIDGHPTRNPSVAVKIVEVRTPAQVARESLDSPEAQLAEARLRMAVAERSAADAGTTLDATRREAMEQDVRAADLQAHGSAADYIRELWAQARVRLDHMPARDPGREAQQQRVDELWDQLQLAETRDHQSASPVFRPQAVIVDEVSGTGITLLLQLSLTQRPDGGVDAWLSDVTTRNAPPAYTASAPARPGHDARLDAALAVFRTFATHNQYGRGPLTVRFPADLGFPENQRQQELVSAPRGTGLLFQRIDELSQVLTAVSLIIPGVGTAVAVLGAGIAAARLIQRWRGDTLRFDVEAANDLIAIVGAVAQGVTAIAGARVVQGSSGWRLVATVASTAGGVAGEVGFVLGTYTIVRDYAQIAHDEATGSISHAEARRRRATAMAGAIQQNMLQFRGWRERFDPEHPAAQDEEQGGQQGQQGQQGGAQRAPRTPPMVLDAEMAGRYREAFRAGVQGVSITFAVEAAMYRSLWEGNGGTGEPPRQGFRLSDGAVVLWGPDHAASAVTEHATPAQPIAPRSGQTLPGQGGVGVTPRSGQTLPGVGGVGVTPRSGQTLPGVGGVGVTPRSGETLPGQGGTVVTPRTNETLPGQGGVGVTPRSGQTLPGQGGVGVTPRTNETLPGQGGTVVAPRTNETLPGQGGTVVAPRTGQTQPGGTTAEPTTPGGPRTGTTIPGQGTTAEPVAPAGPVAPVAPVGPVEGNAASTSTPLGAPTTAGDFLALPARMGAEAPGVALTSMPLTPEAAAAFHQVEGSVGGFQVERAGNREYARAWADHQARTGGNEPAPPNGFIDYARRVINVPETLPERASTPAPTGQEQPVRPSSTTPSEPPPPRSPAPPGGGGPQGPQGPQGPGSGAPGGGPPRRTPPPALDYAAAQGVLDSFRAAGQRGQRSGGPGISTVNDWITYASYFQHYAGDGVNPPPHGFVGPDGHVYLWTPRGQLRPPGEPTPPMPSDWARAAETQGPVLPAAPANEPRPQAEPARQPVRVLGEAEAAEAHTYLTAVGGFYSMGLTIPYMVNFETSYEAYTNRYRQAVGDPQAHAPDFGFVAPDGTRVLYTPNGIEAGPGRGPPPLPPTAPPAEALRVPESNAPVSAETQPADLARVIDNPATTTGDLMRLWFQLGSWSRVLRWRARQLTEPQQARLAAARQALFDEADQAVRRVVPESEARRQLAGSTGVTSDMDPTYMGPRSIEAWRLFVEGMEAALRRRGLPTEGWMEVLGVNPYTDVQADRFGLTENTPAQTAARARLEVREGQELEMAHRERLMRQDPSGARWREYVDGLIQAARDAHPGDAGPAEAVRAQYEAVDARAALAEAELLRAAGQTDPRIAAMDPESALRLLRSPQGADQLRAARRRMLERAHQALARLQSEASTPPTDTQREAILAAAMRVKTLEDEAYHPSAVQSVVFGQQEAHQQRVEQGQAPGEQPNLTVGQRQNALIDSLNMLQDHLPAVREGLELQAQPNVAADPLAKYFARVMLEARELGIPVPERFRLLGDLARRLRAGRRIGPEIGSGGSRDNPSGARMAASEATAIEAASRRAGLIGADGQVDPARLTAMVNELDGLLRTSVALRRAVPDNVAAAQVPRPDTSHPWSAAAPSEPTTTPANRRQPGVRPGLDRR